jgi:rubrerythrin
MKIKSFNACVWVIGTAIACLLIACIDVKAGTFKNIVILKEETRKYSVREVMQSENLPYTAYVPGKGTASNKEYWLRFEYCNTDLQSKFYLFAPYILHNRVDLYYAIDDSLHHYNSGVSLKFEDRPLYHPDIYLKLPTSKAPVVCWLHIKSFHGYFFFFEEAEAKMIVEDSLRRFSIEYFFIGISFLAGIISLTFYIFLKDKMYLFYGIFSTMILMSRLVFSGNIFIYLSPFFEFDTLDSIYRLYGIANGGISLSLLFYFHQYLAYSKRSKRYFYSIYTLAVIRGLILIVDLGVFKDVQFLRAFHLYDLLIQLFIMLVILKGFRHNVKLSSFAGCSLLIIIIGNVIHLLPKFGLLHLSPSYFDNYNIFLNSASLEVIVFAVIIAYRNHYLKKDRDLTVLKMMDNMREKEQMKDQLNKELEIKVAERTKQIREMNDVLKFHNIELKTEVKSISEARVFHKTMNFDEFQKIFANDDVCFQYLASLKWKPEQSYLCKKCGYQIYPMAGCLSVRCGKCLYTAISKVKIPDIESLLCYLSC